MGEKKNGSRSDAFLTIVHCHIYRSRMEWNEKKRKRYSKKSM